ncbi:MAG: hypothetical protein M1820_007071 [Bogoriella megaspora]|nr:MAG: hypothetical protein M1820_007071 [Bogoriella megaspora]
MEHRRSNSNRETSNRSLVAGEVTRNASIRRNVTAVEDRGYGAYAENPLHGQNPAIETPSPSVPRRNPRHTGSMIIQDPDNSPISETSKPKPWTTVMEKAVSSNGSSNRYSTATMEKTFSSSTMDQNDPWSPTDGGRDEVAFVRTTSGDVLAAPGTVVLYDDLNVQGTTVLYEDGNLKFIPMPSADPKDPLNLPSWRKWAAITALCFYGAVALASEIIIGMLVPVFVLYYAGIDPKILGELTGVPTGPDGKVDPNPVSALSSLGGPPIWRVYLLTSLPLLTNGLSNYFLVPLAIAVGRRPVLLLCGALAWAGSLWAGSSTSLNSHIAARCVQGLGAGTVEALVPLVVQDFVFIHRRNTAISAVWSWQAAIIVSIGLGAPYAIAELNWRWLYYILGILGAFSWVLLLLFVPETRWLRTSEELNGESTHPLPAGMYRPPLDPATYGNRNFKSNFGIFTGNSDWRWAGTALYNTMKSALFPNMIWMILVNSIFMAITNSAYQLGAPALLAANWPFKHLGLGLVPIVCAMFCTWGYAGVFTDWFSNYMAKRRNGRREPEVHLISLSIPILCGIIGCLMFGAGGQYIVTEPWIILLIGIFFIAFSFLSAITITSVYVVESYPEWAGPVLVNVSSFRCIIGFAFAFKVSDWVQDRGYFGCFAIYAGVLALLALGLPIVYLTGKRIRKYTGRFVGIEPPSDASSHADMPVK